MITRSGRYAGGYGKRRPFKGSSLFFACILVVSLSSKGQQGPLQDSIRKISANAHGTVGVAFLVTPAPVSPAAHTRFAFNGNGH